MEKLVLQEFWQVKLQAFELIVSWTLSMIVDPSA
jgi:hypothetical protein